MPGIYEHSRGTGPRATGQKRLPLRQRSRGTGNRATVVKAAPSTVGRGPVPRHAWDIRTLAGDRPPRYDEKNVSSLRQRSRGTGPRATGKKRLSLRQRSRGTGPRATGHGRFSVLRATDDFLHLIKTLARSVPILIVPFWQLTGRFGRRKGLRHDELLIRREVLQYL